MTDCRLLTIVLIVAVVAIVFFVFGGCRVECDAKREGLDLKTNVFAYEYASNPAADPFSYRYGMAKKGVPLELAGHGAYQSGNFLGLPENLGPFQCGPCE
nr:hypothetical protein [Marseillevirus cajuinensis]